MKFILLALALTFCSAQLYDHATPADWRNASYDASEFVQGFAFGAFESEITDITGCATDAMDIIQTLKNDYQPILTGDWLAKVNATIDIISHMIDDLPNILLECGHLKNDTMDIIEVTRILFEDLKDFHKIASILFSQWGPALKLITSSAIAIEQGNWYKGGLNLGKVFRIIASTSQKEQ